MKLNKRSFFVIFTCIVSFLLFIYGWLSWKDGSYFESEPYIKEGDIPSNILVIYYSRTGRTEAIAREFARRFEADLFQITDQPYYHGVSGMVGANRDSWF